MSVPRPRPVPTPETQYYWDKAAAGELWLPRCVPCDHVFWYPRSHCPTCGSTEVDWVRATGRGRLASFVVNHTPHPGYAEDGPYVMALVELAEGVRLLTNLLGVPADPEHVHVGMTLEVTFEDRGEGLQVPQFRPVPA